MNPVMIALAVIFCIIILSLVYSRLKYGGFRLQIDHSEKRSWYSYYTDSTKSLPKQEKKIVDPDYTVALEELDKLFPGPWDDKGEYGS